VILVLCAIGAFTVHNSTFDVFLMLVFGVLGYFMKVPLSAGALVLAIVLAIRRRRASASLCSPRRAACRSSSQRAGRVDHGLGLIALFWPVIHMGCRGSAAAAAVAAATLKESGARFSGTAAAFILMLITGQTVNGGLPRIH